MYTNYLNSPTVTYVAVLKEGRAEITVWVRRNNQLLFESHAPSNSNTVFSFSVP